MLKRPQERPLMPALQAVLAALLFGTTGTAQAIGPGGTTPVGIGAVRLVVGGAGLLTVLPFLGLAVGDAARLWRTGRGIIAGVSTAGYQLCFFACVNHTGVAVGTLVAIGSAPIFTGTLAWRTLAERPTRRWVAATGICASGLALLTLGGAAGAAGEPVGVLLGLGSGLAYAVYTVTSRSLVKEGARSEVVMTAAFGLGGLLLLPVLAVQPVGWVWTPPGAVLALYLGLGTVTLAYVLFGRSLTVLPAAEMTTMMLAEPLVATALGVLVLGEGLPAIGMAGAVLTLVGLVTQGWGTVWSRPAESTPLLARRDVRSSADRRGRSRPRC
jgi:DME family drug/metabolite transporter